MTIPHHDPAELMAAADWGIDGTLLDANGQPLDLSNANLTWTLIGPDGLPALQNGDASITVLDQASGLIRIDVANAKTAQLECGRYLDALQLTIGDIVSPLWTGVIPRALPLLLGNSAATPDRSSFFMAQVHTFRGR